MTPSDADYWQNKYWQLFVFASEELGKAFEAACETRELPIDPPTA
jgi:hypothetical protein